MDNMRKIARDDKWVICALLLKRHFLPNIPSCRRERTLGYGRGCDCRCDVIDGGDDNFLHDWRSL
jgi:hypothetical protein